MLPIGLGLLLAANDPFRRRALLAIGVLASWLHAFNHTYDGLFHSENGQAGLLDAGMMLGLALVLSVGAWLALAQGRTSARESRPDGGTVT